MKKNFLKILLIALVTFTATACTKEDTSGNNNGTGSSSGSDVFVWTENDNTFAAANTIKCDSAYASAQFKTIFVYKGATTTRYFYEINLSSLAVGAYSITSTSANAVAYIRPSSTGLQTGTAGSISISANASNKITGDGTISMPFAAGGNTTSRVYIKFTNLPVR